MIVYMHVYKFPYSGREPWRMTWGAISTGATTNFTAAWVHMERQLLILSLFATDLPSENWCDRIPGVLNPDVLYDLIWIYHHHHHEIDCNDSDHGLNLLIGTQKWLLFTSKFALCRSYVTSSAQTTYITLCGHLSLSLYGKVCRGIINIYLHFMS